MGFWITFGFFGLLFVPLAIMFICCGATAKNKIGGAIFCLVFWILFAGGLTLDTLNKEAKWNNGYCDCGTHWELRGASKSRNGTVTKYYVCENCHIEIEI